MNKITQFLKQSANSIMGVGIAAVALAVVSIPGISHAQALGRDLSIGNSGSDVSALQTFLAQNNTIYPQGLVTGYFGFLTKAAVSNFQVRNGIEGVGAVGLITLPVLNTQIANGMSVGTTVNGSNNGANNIAANTAPSITSVVTEVSSNSAVINWNTNAPATGIVYYSTSPLSMTGYNNSVTVSGNTAMTNTNLQNSQSVTIPNLASNTTYYYAVYATNQQGNASVTWPTTFQTQ